MPPKWIKIIVVMPYESGPRWCQLWLMEMAYIFASEREEKNRPTELNYGWCSCWIDRTEQKNELLYTYTMYRRTRGGNKASLLNLPFDRHLHTTDILNLQTLWLLSSLSDVRMVRCTPYFRVISRGSSWFTIAIRVLSHGSFLVGTTFHPFLTLWFTMQLFVNTW